MKPKNIGKSVTLTLSPDMAEWLRAVMQNPLHVESPLDEPDEDNYYRRQLWEALNQ